MDALRPLSLDQFAAMTAEMEAGFARDRVLADATVSAEQWELTQETWLLRMAKQGQQRKLALLDRYNELLAKHRKAAQRKMRAEKRRLKGPMPVAPEAHLSPLARTRTEDGTGATFQQAGVATAPGAAWAVTSGSQGAPAAPSGIAAPPLVTPPPVVTPGAAAPSMAAVPSMAAAPSMAAVPSMVAAPAMFAADDADDADDSGEGMTFVGAAVEVPTGPAWLEAKKPAPPPALTGTARMDGMPLPAAGAIAGPSWLAAKPPPRAEEPRPAPAPSPSSPGAPAAGPAWLNSSASFSVPLTPTRSVGGDGQAASPTQAPPPAQAAARPARRGGTLMDMAKPEGMPQGPTGPAWLAQATSRAPAEGAGARGADALPFQRAAAPSAPPPAMPSDGLPFQRAATAGAPAPHAAPPVQAAVVAQPAQAAAAQAARPATHSGVQVAAPGGPRLSIEQLAWLQAQVETSAEMGRAAREKLGLSEAEYAGERAFWQARFQQDRATVERYSQLFYHYKRGR